MFIPGSAFLTYHNQHIAISEYFLKYIFQALETPFPHTRIERKRIFLPARRLGTS